MDGAAFTAISTYCTAWNELDRSVRQDLLEASCTPGIKYIDPTVDIAGLTELSKHIGNVLASRPEDRIQMGKKRIIHGPHVLFDWSLLDADGQTRRRGIDHGELSASNKLKVMVGFFLDD